MAKSHTTDGKWTNPDVRFERGDVDYRGVVIFTFVLGTALIVVVPTMFWYGRLLLRMEQPRKVTSLPPAAVDADRLPPEPRLEALEDLREKRRPKLFPDRADDYLAVQKRLLKDGDPGKKVVPIELAIDELAKDERLKAREKPASVTPLPGKASSGREVIR